MEFCKQGDMFYVYEIRNLQLLQDPELNFVALASTTVFRFFI